MFDIQSEYIKAPLYQSHKKIRAMEITAIYSDSCVGVGPDRVSVTFPPANRPVPQIGWYMLFYPDGYMSFSPKAQFEEGYSRIEEYNGQPKELWHFIGGV